MNHGSLFSGIGGFDLAAEWIGWKNVFQVEKDSFCKKVLSKHFPDTELFDDVKTFNGKFYANTIDVLTGGFPCQPFSSAGKRKGKQDERYLWEDMLRIIQEVQPRWIVAENVYGLLTMQGGMVFEQMLLALESNNYEAVPIIIPAAGVDAPHKRDRVWIIAHANSNATNIKPKTNSNNKHRKCKSERNDTNITSEFISNFKTNANINEQRPQGNDKLWNQFAGFSEWQQVEPIVCRGSNGIPNRMDRIRGLGNAIVPQIAYKIFKAIQFSEDGKQ